MAERAAVRRRSVHDHALPDRPFVDAYMLLVEVAGKRILHSGDFRRHGRKAALVDRMMASPPGPVELLVMEGTNVGTDKPWMSECAAGSRRAVRAR